MPKSIRKLLSLSLFLCFLNPVYGAPSKWDTWHQECLARVQQTRDKGYRKDFNQGIIVCISFFIDRKGEVTGVKVHRSSGYRAVDKAALQIIKNAEPFKPFESLSQYKTGVIAEFTRDVKLRFYDANKMPTNYDANKQFLQSWFKKAAQKIKVRAVAKSTDPNAKSKWVNLYALEKPAKCTFRLGPNGEVYDLVVSESSGDEKIDKLAMRLINQVSPFHMVSVTSLKGANIDVFFANGDVKLEFAKKASAKDNN